MALTKIKTGGIADNSITNAKMADDAIDSADFVDGSIDNAHLAGSIAVSKTLLSASELVDNVKPAPALNNVLLTAIEPAKCALSILPSTKSALSIASSAIFALVIELSAIPPVLIFVRAIMRSPILLFFQPLLVRQIPIREQLFQNQHLEA
jgi:hypothetical protein